MAAVRSGCPELDTAAIPLADEEAHADTQKSRQAGSATGVYA